MVEQQKKAANPVVDCISTDNLRLKMERRVRKRCFRDRTKAATLVDEYSSNDKLWAHEAMVAQQRNEGFNSLERWEERKKLMAFIENWG